MSRSARERANLMLTAVTRLSTTEIRALLHEAGRSPGIDAGLVLSARSAPDTIIRILHESASSIELSVDNGACLCSFTAELTSTADGRTHIRIGGLSNYHVEQSKLYGIVPVGPETILGYHTYRAFLRDVADTIRARDPLATVRTRRKIGS